MTTSDSISWISLWGSSRSMLESRVLADIWPHLYLRAFNSRTAMAFTWRISGRRPKKRVRERWGLCRKMVEHFQDKREKENVKLCGTATTTCFGMENFAINCFLAPLKLLKLANIRRDDCKRRQPQEQNAPAWIYEMQHLFSRFKLVSRQRV